MNITFQPLSGVMGESPPCYLLKINDLKILLDCGWDDKFDINVLKTLKSQVNSLDVVLLSQSNVNHLGLLPILVRKLKLRCPIFATEPIKKLGRYFLYDLYYSHESPNFGFYSIQDIDEAFDKIVDIKYKQTIIFTKSESRVVIQALQSGYMLGGTIWKISTAGNENIVYASVFNEEVEVICDGCWWNDFMFPSVFIVGAGRIKYIEQNRGRKYDKLMETIMDVLLQNGNILLPIDSAGRILEIAYMLDTSVAYFDSGSIGFSFVSAVSVEMMTTAHSLLDWIGKNLYCTCELKWANQMKFRKLEMAHDYKHLLNKQRQIVLATPMNMECGFSRALFLEWCTNPNNAVIFTTKSETNSFARNLCDLGPYIHSILYKDTEEVYEIISRPASPATPVVPDSTESPDSPRGESSTAECSDILVKTFRIVEKSTLMRCQTYYFDYEGKCDGNLLTRVISNIKPAKIVVVGCSIADVCEMDKFCLFNLDSEVIAPGLLETVTLRNSKPVLSVSKNLCNLQNLQPPDDTERTEYFNVRELDLMELRYALAELEIYSEIRGEKLLCSDGRVMIKLIDFGTILLQGRLDENYYIIKKLILTRYAITF